MPLVERRYKDRRQWAKGSESVAHLRTPSVSFKGNGTYLGGKSDGNALFHPRSPHWDDGRAWSFVSGQTAMANGNLEGIFIFVAFIDRQGKQILVMGGKDSILRHLRLGNLG
jgi:hypothetical protein